MLLNFDDPATVFTVIGLFSCLAFVPALFVRFEPTPMQAEPQQRPSIPRQLAAGFAHTATRVEMWFAGILEMMVYSVRSEEHTSELQSLMRISYAVFCLKKKKNKK